MTAEVPVIQKGYFNLHFFLLKIMGVAVLDINDPARRRLYKIYSMCFLIFCVYIYIITEAMDLIDNWGDLDNMTFNLCYLVTHFTGLCKATVILIQRKKIEAYCAKLESGHFLPNYERGGLEEYAIIGNAVRVSNVQAYIFHAFVITIVANRGFYAGFDRGTFEDYHDAETNATLTKHYQTTPYTTWFPFDTNVSPYYEIAFTYQMVSCTFYGLLIGTCDALIAGFMVHLKAQILILKNSLGNYVERAERKQKQEYIIEERAKTLNNLKKTCNGMEVIEKITPGLQKHVTKFVGECIHHHQGIIFLSERAEAEFNLLMLAQFLGSLLLMCFQLFQLSLCDVKTPRFFSMVCYLMLMLFQLLIYCWNGNEVQLESLDVANAVYNSKWIVTDTSTQRALMLMIRRSQRPIRLSAGKFAHLSLETFTTILRGSGSYYMVLRRVNE